MQINDLSKRVGAYQNDILSALKQVVNTGWLILGSEVKKFENAFAEYIGVSHCISVANGTDAIELSMKALQVKPGSLVATVANAGMYTSAAILAIGAEPYFMDVDVSTHNVSIAEVEKAIEMGVDAVVVTHLYGAAVRDIEAIAGLCRKRGVALLEDCAQAHGALVNGKRVGAFGDAASFSFYPTKNLGALGDGGAIVTRSDETAERLRQLRQYGWTKKYHVGVPGGRNSRLDELQAAVLMVFLPHLDEANAKRRYIADLYDSLINHPLVKKPGLSDESSVAHLYVIRSSARDSLFTHMRSQGILVEIHYPVPDHRQDILRNKYKEISLENTEILADEILTLPCYPEMSEDDVKKVAMAINEWRP
ncbi:DegT/DnrJ/EryC1/StrS family aminotransferase [Delftia tsuruhatensis]|uniref:DegT/DnrJ/EryC1/StrS family aminotransferase n=1 Tax=Delftia tsuruhatensis TaxID=180282 RepID=UPI0030CA806F